MTRSIVSATLLLMLAAMLVRPEPHERPASRVPAVFFEPDRFEQSRPASDDMDPVAALLPVTEGLGPARRIEQDAEERFWAKVADRESVISATAEYLGWDERQKAAAWSAVLTIEEAWRIRNLDPGSESGQETYEAVKRLALESLSELLDGTRDRHRRFGDRLEEWIDTVR